ncbi:MAG: hypothetical protein IPH77_13480 [Ignavibacteria bacterium]|nr:hypothetical protein [Ignavibacteria bacterium]
MPTLDLIAVGFNQRQESRHETFDFIAAIGRWLKPTAIVKALTKFDGNSIKNFISLINYPHHLHPE